MNMEAIDIWLAGSDNSHLSEDVGEFIVSDIHEVIHYIKNRCEIIQQFDCEVTPAGLSPFVAVVQAWHHMAEYVDRKIVFGDEALQKWGRTMDMAAAFNFNVGTEKSPIEKSLEQAEIANAHANISEHYQDMVSYIIGHSIYKGTVFVIAYDFRESPIAETWYRAARRLRHRRVINLFTNNNVVR